MSVSDSEVLSPWTWSMPSLMNKNFPTFSKPKEVGHFSKIKESVSPILYSDSRALSRYSSLTQAEIRSRKIDLNEGLQEWNPSPVKNCDDPCLLQWLADTKRDLTSFDFVCWRGLLTILASTPYERRDEWQVAVIKRNDVIFLYRFETEAQLRSRMEQMSNERQRRFVYWGYRFEKYMTEYESKSTDASVRDDSFVSVVETHLGDLHLLFGGEVDCIDLSTVRQHSNPGNSSQVVNHNEQCNNSSSNSYVELKTSRIVETKQQQNNFNHKLLKWWLQSFLIGIPRIVAGFRDDAGLVLQLQEFQVAEMHRLTRDFWSPSVCFNFLFDFLRHVKTSLQNASYEEVFVFRWKPSPNRYQVQCEKFSLKSQYYFLPQDFI